MANSVKPMGLVPVKHIDGSPYNGGGHIYAIPNGYGTRLRPGDPVVLAGSGDSNGVPTIQLATATGVILGAILGIGKGETMLANPQNLDQAIYPAGGDNSGGYFYALVEDSPDVIYQIMDPQQSTQLQATNIGQNSALAIGNTSNFLSDWTLAPADGSTTPATTAGLPVQLLGLARIPNNTFGAGAQWLCRINTHQFQAGVAGV